VNSDTWRCRTHDDNEWCTATNPCFDCAELAHDELHPTMDEPDCRTCKLRSVQLSPAATPTKTKKFAAFGPKGNNSWERQIVTDDRNMPLTTADGTLIKNGDLAANRSKIEEGKRRLRNGQF
jgi:hypothetical protein